MVVELRARLDSALVASTVADANGNFSFTVITNGDPLDVYVTASRLGYVTTNWVPPEPYRESTSGIQADLAIADDHDEYALLAGTSRNPALGYIWVIVLECDGTPVAGATVDTLPSAGTLVYGDNQALPNPLLSATFNGLAFAFNVPVGSVQVSAMTAVPFAAHDVPSFADEFTVTIIHP